MFVALALLIAFGGCRSGGKSGRAKEPGAALDPSGGTAGTGAGEADGAAGQPGTDGAPGGSSGSSGGTGGAGGSGGSGGSVRPTRPRDGADRGGADRSRGRARPTEGVAEAGPGPLRARHSASAVWTGREMIVWGGAWRAGNASIWLDDGAAYDPAGDRWRRLAGSPLAARSEAVIAWTGREVLVWGGQRQSSLAGFGDEFSDGALYDPVKNTWKPMAAWPLAERYGARAVWTGTRLVVWGGALGRAGEDPPPLADGAAYDPATTSGPTWPAAPLAGRIAPLAGARGGSALFSWGPAEIRNGERAAAADSALYDAGPNRWSPAAAAPAPPKQTWCLDAGGCVGVDTGTGVVFAGQGLAWDAAGDRWATIAASAFADPFLEGKAQVWTGSRIMLWGGGTADSPGESAAGHGHAGRCGLRPRRRPLGGAPRRAARPRARTVAVWTGRELIVWGGEADYNHRAQFDDGAAYTP